MPGESPEDVEKLNVGNPDSLACNRTTLSMDDTYDVIDALVRVFRYSRPQEGRYLLRDAKSPGCRRSWRPNTTCLLLWGHRLARFQPFARIGRSWVRGHILWTTHTGVQRQWLENVERVGVTAGASAPEVLVKDVLGRLREWGGVGCTEVEGRSEKVTFPAKSTVVD